MQKWQKGLLLCLTLTACTTHQGYFHHYEIDQTTGAPALTMPPGLELKQTSDYRLPLTKMTRPASPPVKPPTIVEVMTNHQPDYHYTINASLASVWQAFPEAITNSHYRLLQTSEALHTYFVAKPAAHTNETEELLQIQSEVTQQGVSILVLNNQNHPVPIGEIQSIIDYLEQRLT